MKFIIHFVQNLITYNNEGIKNLSAISNVPSSLLFIHHTPRYKRATQFYYNDCWIFLSRHCSFNIIILYSKWKFCIAINNSNLSKHLFNNPSIRFWIWIHKFSVAYYYKHTWDNNRYHSCFSFNGVSDTSIELHIINHQYPEYQLCCLRFWVFYGC